VLEQKVTAEHVLGLIYTIDEGDDWRDPAMWVKANPMLGVTPTVEWVTQYCADAQQAPGLEGEFRIKVCSEWANASHTWLSMTAWDACADPTLRLEQFAGEPCWIGLDLAQVNDIAAAALCFQRDGLIYAFFKGYLPRDVVEQRARAVPAYREWVRLGLIETTEGNLIDQRRIEQDVHAWCRQFQVQAIWCDRFDATRLLADLLAAGLPAAELTKNRLSMTAPARDLEARVLAGRFRHDGNGCLRWMASNVAVTRGVDDSLLPKKADAESPNKIDGIDAILTGMAAMLAQPPVPEYQILVL
jgi:phage terminase large subunit-like protein